MTFSTYLSPGVSLQGGGSSSGGGGTPGGSTGQVQYNNGGAFAGMAGTSWDNAVRSLTITGYSLTGSASASFVDLAGTWNTSGTPTLIKANVTDTASNASSLLMDLQVGGSSRVKVDKTGGVTAAGGFTIFDVFSNYQFIASTTSLKVPAGNIIAWSNSANNAAAAADLTLRRRGAANLAFGAADAAAPVAQTLSVQSVVAGTTNTAGANLTITGSQGTGDQNGGAITFQVAPKGTAGTNVNALQTVLQITGAGGLTGQDGTTANTLALRNGTTAQTFNVYNTFTDASNYERLSIYWSGNEAIISTQNAGTGSTRPLKLNGSGGSIVFQTGGFDRWSVGPANHFLAAVDNSYDIGESNQKRPRNVFIAGYNQLSEMTAPAAPAANGVRIYAEDNGSGKTRLMALFATGAAQQIAIEP